MTGPPNFFCGCWRTFIHIREAVFSYSLLKVAETLLLFMAAIDSIDGADQAASMPISAFRDVLKLVVDHASHTALPLSSGLLRASCCMATASESNFAVQEVPSMALWRTSRSTAI